MNQEFWNPMVRGSLRNSLPSMCAKVVRFAGYVKPPFGRARPARFEYAGPLAQMPCASRASLHLLSTGAEGVISPCNGSN
jgi:hypothetical protein